MLTIRLITKLISTLWLLNFPTLAHSSPSPDECLQPIRIDDPDLSKIGMQNTSPTPLGNAHLKWIEYSFLKKQHDELDIEVIIPRRVIHYDTSEFYDNFVQTSNETINENESCNLYVTPHSHTLIPTKEGDLEGYVYIDAKIRHCWSFHYPCGIDIEGVNITVKNCLAKGSAEIDSHTFGSKIHVQRVYTDDNPQTPSFKTTTYFDKRGYSIHDNKVANILINITGIATLNIGSKAFLDFYRGEMRGIDDKVNMTLESDGINNISGNSLDYLNDNLILNKELTKFKKTGASNLEARSFGFQHVSEAEMDSGYRPHAFCEKRIQYEMFANYLRSLSAGDQTITSQEGDTLWKLSEKHYGSGLLFTNLLRPNSIPFKSKDKLAPGKKIIIPAMHKIWNEKKHFVRKGDSLWKISENEYGEGLDYKKIYEQNKDYIHSQELIYPSQLIQLQNKP